MNRLLLVLSLVLVSLSLASCSKSGRRSYYVQPWYDVYGYHCGDGNPRPGCNFYSTGVKIVDTQDPYFYSSYYLDFYIIEPYYDSYGSLDFYTGWGWYSPTGVFYTDSGYALNNTADQGMDVVGDVAEKEKQVVRVAAKRFSAKYALSEETGNLVANTMYNNMKNFSLSHKYSDKDEEAYVKALAGVSKSDLRKVAQAADKGDLEPGKQLNNKIASHWRTDPETSGEVMKAWFGELLEPYGVK